MLQIEKIKSALVKYLQKNNSENSQQGELFSQNPKKEDSGKSHPKASSTKRRIILYFLLFIFFSMGYCLGRKQNENQVNRKATIYRYNAPTITSFWKSYSKKKLILSEVSKGVPLLFSENFTIEMDSVKRIDMDPPEELEPKERENNLSEDEKYFLGRYKTQVSQHSGYLTFYLTKNGHLGGSIRFTNWGKGKAEYLTNIRVLKNNIRFHRSCSGAKCLEIGTLIPLNQNFEGTLSKDRHKIEGTYTGGKSNSRWEAIKL